jgi:uncharacterized protein YgiM (DUF1202 family)
MKTNCWLVFGLMVATGALAQDTNLPPAPAPVAEVAPVSAPIVEPVKKPAPPKRKLVPLNEPTVALLPGTASVAVSNLNVRGQAGLNGEGVARLTKGDVVTVLMQINLDKHKIGEPTQWAKILLPASAHVWVNAAYIDATNKTVLPKKLNLRAGPSEYYNVLGVIERGTVVNEVINKGDWMRIDPPTNAVAFVAAMYLKQVASGNMATNLPASTETEVVPTPVPVVEPAPIVTQPVNPPPPAPAPAPEPAPAPAPVVVAPEPPPAPPVVETNLPPPPPRIVTHEGVVRHVKSVIEPTDFEIYDPKTGAEINYLYTTTTNLDFGRYNGLRIVVTGEEGLSERWRTTPVLTVQRIQVVE